MANALKDEKRKIATATQRNRQDERFARKVSSDFDAKVTAMEEKMKEQDMNSAGLVATLDDVIANNSRLTNQSV